MTTSHDGEVVVTVLTSASSREDIIEALEILGREAHREQHVIGTEDYPSRWDRLHEFIDSLLDELTGR